MSDSSGWILEDCGGEVLHIIDQDGVELATVNKLTNGNAAANINEAFIRGNLMASAPEMKKLLIEILRLIVAYGYGGRHMLAEREHIWQIREIIKRIESGCDSQE